MEESTEDHEDTQLPEKYELGVINDSSEVIQDGDKVTDKDEDSLAMPPSEEEEEEVKKALTYPLTTNAPVHVALLYGVQQLLENCGGLLISVYLVHANICGGDDWLLYAELMSIMFFMIGLATLLQLSFGYRLPILEGNAFAYIPPIVAMANTNPCPEPCIESNSTVGVTDATSASVTQQPCASGDEVWRPRLLEISGSLMCAAAVQMALGLFGIVGWLMRYISPLTIAVTVGLLGISLFPSATDAAQHHWGIAILTFVLYVIFSLVLGPIPVPFPAWNRAEGWHWVWYPFFRTFPSLLALGLAWLLCYILTVTDVFPDDPDHPNYYARTDTKLEVLEQAQWFYLPYPGRYGLPTVGVGVFVGFLGSVIASTIESMGDYYAIARVVEVPPPPKHAVNRGICTEGLCSMIGGALGSCLGTTSYSAIAGLVGITGLGSRTAWMIVSLVFLVAGVIGKFSAALSLCPDPVIGGFNIIGLGMIAAVGLSQLQFCDMKSARNLVILGSSIMLGLMLPYYMAQNPDAFKTGFYDLDQIISIILSTAMCVGGITCFLLDNLVRPGNLDERGINALRATLDSGSTLQIAESKAEDLNAAYDLPFGSDWMRANKPCTFVPILPSYIDREMCTCCKRCKKSHVEPEEGNVNGAFDSSTYTDDVEGVEKDVVSFAEDDAHSKL